MHCSLKLFVAGGDPVSQRAVTNLNRLLKSQPSNVTAEIIDIFESPAAARDYRIVALPLLVRVDPTPIRKIVGDLSLSERVLEVLELLSPSQEVR